MEKKETLSFIEGYKNNTEKNYENNNLKEIAVG